jgi:hypothetical protein
MKTKRTKILKLLQRMKDFVSVLERRRIIHVHQNVSQFYYMERIAELSALLEQFEETQKRLDNISDKLEVKYVQSFQQWRSDILWIHRCEQCNSE